MDKTHNLRYLRAMNRATILRRLATFGPATRGELAAQLGLTKMAISTITSEMLADGLIAESGSAVKPAASGRHPSALALRPEAGLAIGLYLSRDAIEGVLCDLTGQICRVWQEPLDRLQGNTAYLAILDRMTDQILQDLATEGRKAAGIGISCIGPLDVQAGRLLAPPNFRQIRDLPLAAHVQQKSGLPVYLDNDMNAAALAEQLYGAARSLQHIVYVGLTNGVGAGIITGGRIFRGGGGYGGEFGHTSICLDGPLCSCGHRGCLELYASIPVLLAQAGAASLDDLLQGAKSDSAAAAWRPRLIEVLALALTNLANLLDPDIILLGHQGVRLAPLLLPELEEDLNQRLFQRQSRRIPIRTAAFGEQTPLIGAACQVFQAIFRGDLLLT